LLVDDEPTIVRGFARILTSAGFSVQIAHDGREAAELARGMSFDAIVSDIAMPEMTGLQLLRSVREHDLDVPVILMTGGPAVESAVQAVEYGALRYLIKPIVSWSDKSVIAYEALVRNEEPTLRAPPDLFEAAERLGRLRELGRIIRDRVAKTLVDNPTVDAEVFVNVHALELDDDSLLAPTSPLSAFAKRVVLEITERAPLEKIKDANARVAQLRNMGYRIAVDDLGAGYAGLTSFAHLEPEVVKVDMSLIRGLDQSPTKQKLLRSIVGLCRDLEIKMIAEGIETVEERDTLVRLGGDLCQGYLFARPGRAFPPIKI
jgi:EAL domain-containing protein (putative c-di-GMP-specific phosphodiesterase class I)